MTRKEVTDLSTCISGEVKKRKAEEFFWQWSLGKGLKNMDAKEPRYLASVS